MKIKEIRVYQADLPLIDPYRWGDGKLVEEYDATVVAVHTDDPQIVGYGEIVPLGSNYLASYAEGVRTGIRELGPKLINQDPTLIGPLNRFMDFHLKGHPYVKSPIDMACWDILGKVSGLPVCTLLGGRQQESVLLYRAITQGPPKSMAEMVRKFKNEGYTRFQLKLGGNLSDDIERVRLSRQVLGVNDVLIGDANTAWISHEALKLAKAVSDLDVYIEQPCRTYTECLTVRQHTNLPFILDENIEDLGSLVSAWKDNAADVVNIKIGKFGGLTKAKKAIDFCTEVGMAMTVEDTWGGDIVTSAILHLAGTVDPKLQFTSTDFNSYNKVKTALIYGAEKCDGGTRMMVPNLKPGLGVEPNWEALGDPIYCIK